MDEKNINIVEETTPVETTITIDYIEVEVPTPTEVEIASAFPAIGATNEQLNHSLLNNRDMADQHPIVAITGLREELDEIESLKSVYSDKIGIANYYEWNEGAYDETGYFVSLVPNSTKIKICEGTNVFGVTIGFAGFIGGQDADVPRDNSYALVATSGLVDVRCELDVEAGDYVTSNGFGYAKKSDSNYGYKVIAKENKKGVDYAVISLGVQADITNKMGIDLDKVDTRLDAAETNIAAAMSVANQAYNKAEESIASDRVVGNQIADAMGKVENMNSDVEDMKSQVATSVIISTQAKAIAESAATSVESVRLDALAASTEALNKAGEIEKTIEPISKWEYTNPTTGETNTGASYFVEYVENDLSTKAEMETVSKLAEENKLWIEKNADQYTQMLSSVDKYSVGEYSQAYGLTLQQAQNILKEGMVYIPTKHDNDNTHTEKYGDELIREFTYGFYYVWMPVLENDGMMWSEAIGEVWFGKEKPAGTTYGYWYDGDKLYLLKEEEYVEVALLAGNVNNRITSMIRQTTDEVAIEVVNARGSYAGLDERLTNVDSQLELATFWKNDNGTSNLAAVRLDSDGNGSNLALVVMGEDSETTLKGASIVLDQDNNSSYIQFDADRIDFTTGDFTIDADHINFTASDYKAIADHIEFEAPEIELDGYVTFENLKNTDGKTIIDGGNITTGIIESNDYAYANGNYSTKGTAIDLKTGYIRSPHFAIDEKGNAYFDGTISANQVRTGLIQSEGYEYKEGNYASSGMSISLDDGWIRAKNFAVDSEGKLYAKNADIEGKITATEGYIGNSLNGFTINSTSITNGKTGYKEFENNGVYLGADGIGLGKGVFYVSNLGAMHAESGNIGGWSISKNAISSKTDPFDDTYYYFELSSSGNNFIEAGYSGHYSDEIRFRLSRQGNLTVKDITLVGSMLFNHDWIDVEGDEQTSLCELYLADDGNVKWKRYGQAGGGGSTSCSHVAGDWIIDKAATCGTSGIRHQICSKCGATIKTEGINPTGQHIYSNEQDTTCNVCGYIRDVSVSCTHSNITTIAAKPATCTTTGLTEGKKCADCGATITAQQTIPKTSHTYVGDICSVCGHDRSCAHSNTITLDAIPATCTTDGKTEGKKCADCGEIITPQETISALGHDLSVKEVAVEATCTTAGKTAVMGCSRCDHTEGGTTIEKLGHDWATTYTTDATSHWYVCNRCDAKKDEAVHSYTEVVDSAFLKTIATCTEAATYYKSCSACGKKSSTETFEYGKPLAHKEATLPAVAAGCETTGLTEGKQCSMCGKITVPQTEIPATGHTVEKWTWSDKLKLYIGTCTVCGKLVQTLLPG